MKKIILGILLVCCLASLGMTVGASDITAVYNGEMIWFDTPPMMVNDRVMVPMRAIFERLGATVEWNQEDRTATAYDSDTLVHVTLDSDTMWVNGNAVKLDAPAMIKNGRTLVPVRAVAEAFDNNVFWGSKSNRVYITDYAIVDLLGEPITTIERLFGGDYEFDDRSISDIKMIYYPDNRFPGTIQYSAKRGIIYGNLNGFCKIADGVYYSTSAEDYKKSGLDMEHLATEVWKKGARAWLTGTYGRKEVEVHIYYDDVAPPYPADMSWNEYMAHYEDVIFSKPSGWIVIYQAR